MIHFENKKKTIFYTEMKKKNNLITLNETEKKI